VLIRQIDHVQLAMPPGGEDTARAFYRDLLGLTETPKPLSMASQGGCWFESGPVKLHLGVEQDFRPARKAHPALVVTDLPAMVTALADGGAEVVPDDELAGYARVFVSDPFGNRLELMEPDDR
jgi:catechol 2,3-dioxygenase-like lactoylglutathione lyase family enzyme